MSTVAVCLPPSVARPLCEELEAVGERVVVLGPLQIGSPDALTGVDALVLLADPRQLDGALLARCDAARVRVVPVAMDDAGATLAARLGVVPVREITARAVLASIAAIPGPLVSPHSDVIAVWGPPGAPGRSTLAIGLATERARGGREVALIDADSHAPAVAAMLGLAEEAPGLAGACRQAARHSFDEAEYSRIRDLVPVGTGALAVLSGINRPSRWPELPADRMRSVIDAVARWSEQVFIDTSALIEQDEQIVSDLDDGPRRNAATIAALQRADRIIAVCAADPIGVARFVRAVTELRELTPGTPITVVVNRVRARAIGIDARGQLRRTLERYTEATQIHFIPDDGSAADRAVLHGQPVSIAAPRSALTAAVRRIAGLLDAPGAARGPSRPREARRRATRTRGSARRSQ
ncbi:CpaE family protein [Microbacterium sp. ZW T5_56]|uniref:AAA family ATPase n=1 Tax=Microbacterium sp. ZW T5_56 TaxID=3378081 RepID=UPI003851D76C